MRARWTFVLLISFVSALLPAAADAEGQRGQAPIEVMPTGKWAKSVVFVAGTNFFKLGEHEYREGCTVLMDLARQNGMGATLALDWPKQEQTLKGVDAVVLFFDGAAKHALLNDDHRKQFQQLVDKGVGVIALHQGVDVPAELYEPAREWFGAVWEKGYSQRAHWVHKYETFPEHPVTRGVTPFSIDDGYLFKLRFVPKLEGVTPLLRTVSPTKPVKLQDGSEDIVAWTYERPKGGRTFAFTGAHLHKSLAEEGYRRLLTNGILWAARSEVPAGGATVELEPATLELPAPKPATAAK